MTLAKSEMTVSAASNDTPTTPNCHQKDASASTPSAAASTPIGQSTVHSRDHLGTPMSTIGHEEGDKSPSRPSEPDELRRTTLAPEKGTRVVCRLFHPLELLPQSRVASTWLTSLPFHSLFSSSSHLILVIMPLNLNHFSRRRFNWNSRSMILLSRCLRSNPHWNVTSILKLTEKSHEPFACYLIVQMQITLRVIDAKVKCNPLCNVKRSLDSKNASFGRYSTFPIQTRCGHRLQPASWPHSAKPFQRSSNEGQ